MIVQVLVGGILLLSAGLKAKDPWRSLVLLKDAWPIPSPRIQLVFLVTGECFLGTSLLVAWWMEFILWCVVFFLLFGAMIKAVGQWTGRLAECPCYGGWIRATPMQGAIINLALVVLLVSFRDRDNGPVYFPILLVPSLLIGGYLLWTLARNPTKEN